MARTSSRRSKGCGLCKPWKYAQHGDATRTPWRVLRQLGKRRRISRKDVIDDERAW